MSKANRTAGRRAWIARLLQAEKHVEARAYASKHGLADWLASISQAVNGQATTPITLSSAGSATLSPSPTLPSEPEIACACAPGGAGVDEPPGAQNQDQFPPHGKNSQLRVEPATGQPAGGLPVGALVAAPVETWPDGEDGEDGEPEVIAALAAVGQDARCAGSPLTERGQSSGGVEPPPLLAHADFPEKGRSVEPEVGLMGAGVTLQSSIPANVAVVGLWPEESEAWVVRELPNPRLFMIRLPDGRLASCWKGGRKWVPKAKLRVRIDKREGDPIYQPRF